MPLPPGVSRVGDLGIGVTTDQASVIQDFNRMEKRLTSFGNQVTKTNRQVERSTQRSTSAFRKQATELERINRRFVGGSGRGSRGGRGGGGRLGGAAGQVGFQIQDIAVQLQQGTNALQVFSQQGSQIAGAFGPGGAVLGAILAVSAAVGGALIPVLSESAARAREAEKANARLAATLTQLGVATEAVARPEIQLAAGIRDVDLGIEDANRRLREEFEGRLGLGGFQDAFAATGGGAERELNLLTRRGRRVQETFAGIAEEFDLSEAQARELTVTMDRFLSGPTVARAEQLQQVFSELSQESGRFATEAQALSTILAESQGLVGIGEDLRGRQQGAVGGAQPASIAALQEQVDLYGLSARELMRHTELAKLDADATDEQINAVNVLVDTIHNRIEAERMAEEQARATAKAQEDAAFRAQAAILEELEAQDRVAAEAERIERFRRQLIRDRIRESIRAEEESVRRTQDAQAEALRIYESNAQTLESVFGRAFASIDQGFGAVIDSFRRSILGFASQYAAQRLVAGILGPAPSIPGRQFGGPVGAGQPYIVGEAGPELFVPSQSGRIEPNAGGQPIVIENRETIYMGPGTTVVDEARLENVLDRRDQQMLDRISRMRR